MIDCLAASALLVLAVVALAPMNLRGPAGRRVIGGERPWRKLGLAICVVVAVMFVAGMMWLDEHRSVRSFAWYWIIILVLLLWLCGLAAYDLWYTRSVIARWRAGTGTLDGEALPRDGSSGKST